MNRKILIPIILAIVLRLYPFNFYGFQGSDAYVHLSVAKQFDLYGIFSLYSLSDYPDGAEISEPLGLYITPILLYRLIPSNLQIIFQLIPILFSVISILASYLFFKEIFDERTALISSFFISLSIANMTRTGMGVYRGEMIMIPFLFMSLFFLVKGLKLKEWKREGVVERTINFSISGVLLGSTSFFWYGYPFAILTMLFALSIAFLVSFIRKYSEKGLENESGSCLMAFSTVMLVAMLVVKIFVFSNLLPVEHKITADYMLFMFPVLFLLFLIMTYLSDKLEEKIKKVIVAVILVSAILIILVTPTLMAIFTGFGAAIPADQYHSSIDELQTPTIEFLFLTLDITLILSILGGIIMILKMVIEPDDDKFLFLVISIPFIYLSLSALRFIFLGSFIFASLSAYFFTEMMKEKRRERIYSTLLVIVFVIMFVHVIQVRSLLEFHNHWEDSLLWIRTNVPLNEGIATWRDDGGIIQAFGERATTVDSVFGQNIEKLSEITNLMLSNETENVSAEYVVFDKNRLVDLQGIANMMEMAGDYSLIDLGLIEDGNMVFTYPTEFNINLSSMTANTGDIPGSGISTDLIIINETGVFHYPAPALRIEGALILQSKNALYISEQVYQSNFLKMTLLGGIDGYKLVYRDTRISIYENCEMKFCA